MPVCRLNDANIAYTDRGTGPTLVLLHGFPLDKSIWDDAGYFLEQHFRVIAPDLRGFGESPCDRPFTIESLADDIHQILMSIGASPCILGGLSMGGYVALAYERQGHRRRALRHWLTYVRLDPVGPWANHAKAQAKKPAAPPESS